MHDKGKVEALLYKQGYRLHRALNPTVWRNAAHDTLTFSIPQSDWRAWGDVLSHLKRQVSSAKGDGRITLTLPNLNRAPVEPRRRIPVNTKASSVAVIAPPKTKGIGIYYDVKEKEALTAEQLAAKEEKRRAQKVKRKAAQDAAQQRRADRDAAVSPMLAIAKEILDDCKGLLGLYNHRIESFPGWTPEPFCALPVDPEIKTAFCQAFESKRDYCRQRGIGAPLPLDVLDEIVSKSLTRPTLSDEVVDKVMGIINNVSSSCIDDRAVDIPEFLEKLERRQKTVDHMTGWMLGFVLHKMQQVKF